MNRVTVCTHPLVQDKLTRLRDKNTSPQEFRQLLEEVSIVLGTEALSKVPMRQAQIQTPLKSMKSPRLEQPVVLAAVLRAGLGMAPGLLRVVPEASVGHIGLYRNEETLNPVRYYVRLPKGLEKSIVVLLDPMLATGGSAVEALRILKTDGAQRITLISLLAARQGVKKVQREHPDVDIMVAAIDPVLNRNGYIVPGLGDAGDRLFNT